MTAVGTALMRGVHARLDRPVLIDDTWGERIVTGGVAGTPDEAAALAERLRGHPNYGTVILRARFTEEALEAAVARGVRQYVIVGAGIDTFGLRRPAFAQNVDVFEVDHPATQGFKLAKLAEAGIAP